MQSCNQMHACYLFQQDKHYDLSYDTGDKALQCGRHVDIFKLWLMWRAKVRGGRITTALPLHYHRPYSTTNHSVAAGLMDGQTWDRQIDNTHLTHCICVLKVYLSNFQGSII